MVRKNYLNACKNNATLNFINFTSMKHDFKFYKIVVKLKLKIKNYWSLIFATNVHFSAKLKLNSVAIIPIVVIYFVRECYFLIYYVSTISRGF